MTKPIQNPTDQFFKISLSQKLIAIDYIKNHASAEIIDVVNLDTLELKNRSFTLPEIYEIHSDVLYRCEYKEKQGYFYFLLVSQSTLDEKCMLCSILRYKIAVMKQHKSQGHDKYPIVYPILLYSGEKSRYPRPLENCDCIDKPDIVRELAFEPPLFVEEVSNMNV